MLIINSGNTLVTQVVRAGIILAVAGMGWMPVTATAQTTQASFCTDAYGDGISAGGTGASNDSYDVPANAVDFALNPLVLDNDDANLTDNFNEIRVSSTQASVTGFHINYTPTFGVGSTTETFTYAVRYFDEVCSEATVTINIGALPVTNTVEAIDDEVDISDNSGPVDIDVLANDTGNNIEVVSVAPTSNGGSVTILGNDDIQYTPPSPLPDNFVDTFSYTIGVVLLDNQAITIRAESDPNTATVTVTGPVTEPPTGDIKARNDKFQVSASNGRTILNVLTNDTPENDVHIESANGNTRGRISVIDNGRRIAYDPPRDLVGTIVENFSYNIVDNEENTLQSKANVQLTVVGRGEVQNPQPGPLAAVPTSSIGKIRSDLPVARAVENLCDLLTFRASNSATHGSLSAAQNDLQICACAIVNEGNVGEQRNAISQLSGGQHQFSDTVMRFAKGSSTVILKRMAQIRKQSVVQITRPTGNALVSSGLAEQLLAELPRYYPASVRARLNDDVRNDTQAVQNTDPRSTILAGYQDPAHSNGTGSHAQSVFDSFTLGKNSVYFSAPLGGSAGDGEGGLFGDQAGVFTSVTTGSGDNDEGQFNFDFDSYDITTGIDYTRPGTDRTRVYGGALSIGKVETDSSNGGSTSSDSIGITLYGSLFKADGWFADGAIGYSKSDIVIERVVDFTASGKTVLQTSNGDTKGDELSLSVGGGKEINLGANNIRADAHLRYIDGSIDGLTEKIGIVGASGSGLALQTDDFDITSFRSELGLQFNRTIGTGFGVVIPFFSVNWIHEFEDRGSDIRARFVVDAYSDGFTQLEEDAPGGSNRPTVFFIPGSDNDSDYAQLSLGSSFAFKRGKSAWISLSSVTGLSGISNDLLTAGFRWELGN